jgi:hypothetical protein
MLLPLLYGCLPAVTYSTATVSIQTVHESATAADADVDDRFVIVSFWEYPTVDVFPGGVSIHNVVLCNGGSLTVSFPPRLYCVAWTPALGTQHFAPKPGVIAFHADGPPRWDIGQPQGCPCCGKPRTEHAFTLSFSAPQSAPAETDPLCYQGRRLFEELLTAKGELLRELSRHRELRPSDQTMVVAKIEQAAISYGIPMPER